MRTYAELAMLDPDAYLDPTKFETVYDVLPVHREQDTDAKQYKKGLDIGS